MNWTEGKLARHSRARPGKQSRQTLLRQKEHFAKARAGLLPSASKQTAPSFSLLPSAAPRQTRDSPSEAALRHTAAPSDLSRRAKRPRLLSSPRGDETTGQPASSRHFGQIEYGQRDPLPAGGLDDPAIREKRQKLLRDHDWAGIHMQKPIPVRFDQSPSGESKWARRRRTTAGGTRYLNDNHHDRLRRFDDSIKHVYRNEGVRITVGSKEIRLGGGNSVRQSPYSPTAPEARQTYRGAPMHGTFLTSSSANSQEKRQSGGKRAIRRNSSVTSVSESSRSHHAKDDSGGRRHLKAPIPIRPLPGLSMSLIGGSLDHATDGSMIAQVGQGESPTPSSRIEGNEVWRRLAALSQSDAGQRNPILDGSDTLLCPRISPGVSTRRQPRNLSAVLPYEQASYGNTVTSGGYQGMSSHDSHEYDSNLGQGTPSAGEPSLSLHSTDVARDGQGTLSYDSAQAESTGTSGVYGHLAEDNGSRRQSADDAGSSLGMRAASPSSESTEYLYRDTDLERIDSSGSANSETDSADQRVADLREVALKLVSRRPETPWWNEETKSVDKPAGCLENFNTDSNDDLQREPPHATQETPERGTPKVNHEHSPSPEPDDVWYKYVFSDTNTDELHKEVLAEAGKECAGNLLGQGGGEDSGNITESELGHNISTAATHWQSSTGATDTRDDITSTSQVSASQNVAMGSLLETQTTGTVFHGWQGPGGPPYAAPSMMQGSTSSDTTYPGQRDGNGSESTTQGMSQGTTDITSSFSSKIAEPPRSIAENASAKENFVFAPPKLFVGKLSESVPSDRPVVAVNPVTLTKPKRGRPKKKALDGRASIKSIPVYHDDPIEDYDELGAQGRVVPSLFKALDTEWTSP